MTVFKNSQTSYGLYNSTIDNTYASNLYQAMRRREQNRTAQRNHRRRKKLAQQQNQLQQAQHSHVPQPQRLLLLEQPQDPVQLLPTQQISHDTKQDVSPFTFERQLWEEGPSSTATSLSKHDGGSAEILQGLQANGEVRDVFSSLTQGPDPESPSINTWNTGVPVSPLSLPDTEPLPQVRDVSKGISMQRAFRPTSSCSGSRRDRDNPMQSSPIPSIAQIGLPHRNNSTSQEHTPKLHQQYNCCYRPPSEPITDRQFTTVSGGSLHGQTCLHLAAKEGSCTLVCYFLSRGMSPNDRDSDGLTALHHAIRRGHKDTVNTLLLGGADTEIADSRGRTALHIAVEQRKDDIVALLIDKGANMHAVTGPSR